MKVLNNKTNQINLNLHSSFESKIKQKSENMYYKPKIDQCVIRRPIVEESSQETRFLW